MSHCLDCGTRLDKHICPNCCEEAHILDYAEDDEFSEEFLDIAAKQRSEKETK